MEGNESELGEFERKRERAVRFLGEGHGERKWARGQNQNGGPHCHTK